MTQTEQISYDIPLVRGYLTRQDTGGTRGWSKRWYQNSYETPTILDCYQSEKATKASSKIDFSEVTDLRIVRTKAEDSNKKRYGFQFKYGKHTHKLLTEGEEEGEYWRDAFNSLLKACHSDSKLQTTKPIVKESQTNEYALVDFYSSDPGILPFKKNDMMIIVGGVENGWCAVEFAGKRGWVPNEFIKPMGLKK
ncbi:SH3 domain-containing protein [Entamoeba marina]